MIDGGFYLMESTADAINMAVVNITHHWPMDICLIGDLNLCFLINSMRSGLTCIQVIV